MPEGVIDVVSPWNFPLHLSIRSVAPALALGNAVVIKPASDTAVTGGIIPARIFEEAGVPAGVISTVAGVGSEIVDHFITTRSRPSSPSPVPLRSVAASARWPSTAAR